MAEANRKTTYDSPSNREDLVDIVYNVDPWETPFVTRIPSTSATNVLHQWPIDSLEAVDESNAVIEGDDPPIDASTNPPRRTNYTQLSDKTLMVSSSQEYTIQAGVDDEVDYQLVKKTKGIRRDVEAILLGNAAKNAGNKTTARVTATVQSWVATNYVTMATAGSPAAPTGDGSDARTAGTAVDITEAKFKEAARKAWQNGGNPDMVLMTSVQKEKFSAFTGNATRFKGAEDKQLVATIDIYDGDFGEYEVVPDRFAKDDYVFLCETNMWALAELQPLYSEPLAKTGHAEKWLLAWEYALEARNEKSSACVADTAGTSS